MTLSALVLLLVTMAMSGVMLLVLSSLGRDEIKGVREWSLANALAMMSMPLFAGRKVLPGLLSIELANALLMGASMAMLAGFLRHLSRPVPVRRFVLAVAASVGVLALLHYGYDSLPWRVVVASLFHGAVCAAIAATVGSSADAARSRYPHLFIVSAAGLLAFGHSVRGTYYAGVACGWIRADQEPFWNVVFFAIGTLALPALTLGAVMLANAGVIAHATYAADHDHLTGAWSRRAFFAQAEREHARAQRGAALSLLVFDVDHFKRINDTHGHGVGDRVLVDIVRRSATCIRQVDVCARLGGEEFAVLLPGTDEVMARIVAERLRAALEHTLPAVGGGVALRYTVSVGLATLAPGESVEALLGRADRALYAAKAGGRNRVVEAGEAVLDV